MTDSREAWEIEAWPAPSPGHDPGAETLDAPPGPVDAGRAPGVQDEAEGAPAASER